MVRPASRRAWSGVVSVVGAGGGVVGGLLVLVAFGQALGAKGRHQRAADLAAVSAAQVMRDHYPRLFEPPVLWDGAPNPRHLSQAAFVALARAAAGRGARRNGVAAHRIGVGFPDAGFGPTRVTVRVHGRPEFRVLGRRRPAQYRCGRGPPPSWPLTPPGSNGRPMPAAAVTAARWPTAPASRCVPMWPWLSTAWPPPPAARPGWRCCQQRLSLRRRTGQAVCRPPPSGSARYERLTLAALPRIVRGDSEPRIGRGVPPPLVFCGTADRCV